MAMTSTEPNVSDSGKYSVTETCKILKINSNTLYTRIEEGFIKVGGVLRSNGRRYFKGSEIKRFWNSQ